MNEYEAESYITQRALDAAAGLGLTEGVTLTFTNDSFNPPAPTDGITWARIVTVHGGGGQETMGNAPNRRFQREGFIMIQVFTPTGSRTKAVNLLAGALRDLYESTSFGGSLQDQQVHCDDARAAPGEDDGEGWWMIVVQVHFQYHLSK